jgi:hypothetical protein
MAFVGSSVLACSADQDVMQGLLFWPGFSDTSCSLLHTNNLWLRLGQGSHDFASKSGQLPEL